MQKAIPTAEWGEHFQWQENTTSSTDFWFPEEIHAINLALHYAEQNEILENTVEIKEKLQEFINACYTFINYERPKKFDGFDWFLSTVFIICKGDIHRYTSFFHTSYKLPQLTANTPFTGYLKRFTRTTFINIYKSILIKTYKLPVFYQRKKHKGNSS